MTTAANHREGEPYTKWEQLSRYAEPSRMPFNDMSSFVAWAFPNILWTLLQNGSTSLMVSVGSIIAVRYGISQTWPRSLLISCGVFVAVFSLLMALRLQPPMPDLQPILSGWVYGGMMSGQDNNTIVLFVNVSNAGQQSGSVKKFSVAVNVHGKDYPGRILALPNILYLQTDKSRVGFPGSDSIYERMSHKIEPGDQISGILAADFKDIGSNDLTYGDAIIKFSIIDVYGRSASAQEKLVHGADEFRQLPGLHPIQP